MSMSTESSDAAGRPAALRVVSAVFCVIASVISVPLSAEDASPSSLTVTASSEADLTVESALAAAGSSLEALTGNTVSELVVAGNGRILFGTDISDYTGDIRCEEGATAVLTVVGGLGGSAGKVYVEDGGALIIDTTAYTESNTFTLQKSEMHIAGSGPDGSGALVAMATVAQRLGVWGATGLVLEGDALIVNRSGKNLDFPIQSPSTGTPNIRMNGHTLTFALAGVMPTRLVVDDENPGHICVTNGYLHLNHLNRFNGGPENTLTLKDRGRLYFIDASREMQFPWTMVFDNANDNVASEHTQNRWDGPVVLEETMRLYAQDSQKENFPVRNFHFYGDVSGPGGFRISSADEDILEMHLYLHSGNNSFKGDVSMRPNTFLHVMADGAVPSDLGKLAFKDAVLDVQSERTVLPSAVFDCSKDIENPQSDAGYEIGGILTKLGKGTLTMPGRAKVNRIDLQAGGLTLLPPPQSPVAGLYACNTNFSVWKDGARLYFDKFAKEGEWPVLHEEVHNSMMWANVRQSLGRTGCTVYDGWFYCAADEAGVWRFASKVDTIARLRVDGVCPMKDYQKQYKVYFENIEITEGWHRIEYCMGRCGDNAGPDVKVDGVAEDIASDCVADDETLAAWKNGGFGLAVYKNVPESDLYSVTTNNFVNFPSDSGNGSVLRLEKPGTEASDALIAAFRDDVGSDRVLLSLSAATNTVLDMSGIPYEVGSVTGFPTVVNTALPWVEEMRLDPGLTVTGDWTVDGAAIASGAAMTVTGGGLKFEEGATLVIDGVADLRPRSVDRVIATADGGITGMPSVVVDGVTVSTPKLRKSGDGKSLVLVTRIGFMITVK